MRKPLCALVAAAVLALVPVAAGASSSKQSSGKPGHSAPNGSARSDQSMDTVGSGSGAAVLVTPSSTAASPADHSAGNAGTSAVVTQPQPLSGADQNPGGANGKCPGGPYCSTRTGAPSLNGNGQGAAIGKPCAGCVGKADNKNPLGQYPNGSDHNAGYECDRNNGIGRTNPAHTGCLSTQAGTSIQSCAGQLDLIGLLACMSGQPSAQVTVCRLMLVTLSFVPCIPIEGNVTMHTGVPFLTCITSSSAMVSLCISTGPGEARSRAASTATCWLIRPGFLAVPCNSLSAEQLILMTESTVTAPTESASGTSGASGHPGTTPVPTSGSSRGAPAPLGQRVSGASQRLGSVPSTPRSGAFPGSEPGISGVSGAESPAGTSLFASDETSVPTNGRGGVSGQLPFTGEDLALLTLIGLLLIAGGLIERRRA